MIGSELQLLLVEDEEAHAELVRRAFEDTSNAEVTLAMKLAEARSLLADEDRTFDLVVTDLRLPDGLGVELIRPTPPVVVMTSQGDEKAAVAAMKAGALDYIVKSETSFAQMPLVTERVVREWRMLQEQRRLEEALLQRERLAAMGATAAVLAHEIGNPLNSMALHAELLRRRLAKLGIEDDKLATQLERCEHEIVRLRDLLSEFRTLARDPDLKLERVDLAALITEVVAVHEPLLAESGIALTASLAQELGSARIDPAKMRQVFLNLLKNAVEAMPDGGAISVEVRRHATFARIDVVDAGCGIPDGLDPFQPFKSTKAEGTGLGLPVCQRIVAAHGGTIHHEPNEPTGTRFIVVLPATA